MTSIDDFINRRWEDAKEVLRDLDGDFVSRLESEQRLQTLGLDVPREHSVGFTPKRGLSKKWHHLFEAFVELTMRVRNVKVAAAGQTSAANARLSSCEAGIQFNCHLRAWVIHVQALAECTHDVIRKTTDVYVSDPIAGKRVSEKHREQLEQQVSTKVRGLRNDYLHARRPLARAITEARLWELSVSTGTTPLKFLDNEFYAPRGDEVKAGEHDRRVSSATQGVLDCVGMILHSLEEDIKSNCDPKYPVRQRE